jgi:uncharacterized protein YcbX
VPIKAIAVDMFPHTSHTELIIFFQRYSNELILNDTIFSLVKPCGRCVITTIDQNTAEKSLEPLKTLSSYRLFNNKLLFGMNALVKRTGKIHLNESVHLVQST